MVQMNDWVGTLYFIYSFFPKISPHESVEPEVGIRPGQACDLKSHDL